MAAFRFALECPKCGSINTASNFLFAKKIIQCGVCGEEINVKESRLISKKCPHCGKVFIYDQTKKEVICPYCNQKMQRYDADTVHYQMVTVHCPQCGCGVEANQNNTDFPCPLCNASINVAAEYTREQLVKDQTISLIKYEGNNDVLVWKHPIEDFNMGSQLLVHESQEAIVYVNGQAFGPYPEGLYTLDNENIPILKSLYKLPADGRTPFHCEVYYINKTVHFDMKWGTPDKIRFLEPASGIPLEIGASGSISLQVSDGRRLLVKLVGTTSGLTDKDILTSGDDTDGGATLYRTLQSCFRAPLVTGVKSYLAQTIREQRINILEIDEKLDELSKALRNRIAPSFEEYGLTIPNFYVTTIVLPENDRNFEDMKALISAEWLKVREAAVSASITVAQRQVELEKQTTELEKLKIEAEMKRIQAQADADATLVKGLTEARIMAAQGYSQKDVLSSEVQKEYAKGLGNFGANGGGGGGTFADLVSLGVGMAAAGQIGAQIGNTFSGVVSSPTQETTVKVVSTTCPKCGKELPAQAKFCLECGFQMEKLAENEMICPNCGEKTQKGKFCMKCGTPLAQKCTVCGEDIPDGAKFCMKCGAKL